MDYFNELVGVQQFGELKLISHRKFQENFQCMICINLIEKWGMVAGKEGPEDSAGRATISLLTEEEVVERAIKTAKIFVEKMESIGWIKEVPSFDSYKEEEKEE